MWQKTGVEEDKELSLGSVFNHLKASPFPLTLPFPLLLSQLLLHQNWRLYLSCHSLAWPHSSLDAWVLCCRKASKKRAGKNYTKATGEFPGPALEEGRYKDLYLGILSERERSCVESSVLSSLYVAQERQIFYSPSKPFRTQNHLGQVFPLFKFYLHFHLCLNKNSPAALSDKPTF